MRRYNNKHPTSDGKGRCSRLQGEGHSNKRMDVESPPLAFWRNSLSWPTSILFLECWSRWVVRPPESSPYWGGWGAPNARCCPYPRIILKPDARKRFTKCPECAAEDLAENLRSNAICVISVNGEVLPCQVRRSWRDSGDTKGGTDVEKPSAVLIPIPYALVLPSAIESKIRMLHRRWAGSMWSRLIPKVGSDRDSQETNLDRVEQ